MINLINPSVPYSVVLIHETNHETVQAKVDMLMSIVRIVNPSERK